SRVLSSTRYTSTSSRCPCATKMAFIRVCARISLCASPPTSASRRSLSVGAARARNTKTRMAVSGWLRRQSVGDHRARRNARDRLPHARQVLQVAAHADQDAGAGLVRDLPTSFLLHNSATFSAMMTHSASQPALEKCRYASNTGKITTFCFWHSLCLCPCTKAFLRSRLPYSQTLAGRWWPLQLD